MFSDDKSLSRKRYKEFVSGNSSEEINVSLGKKKLPSILGGDEFIQWVKKTFFTDKGHMEVLDSRSLSPDIKRITTVVCTSYNVEEKTLTLTRRGIANEPRSVAIYLTRHLRGDSLKEIGREFKIAKYSSVNSVIERVKSTIAKDRNQRRRVMELKEKVNMSQEQT
jgi:hypothetical protein